MFDDVINRIPPCIGMICLALISMVSLEQGVDGGILASCIICIAGLGGFDVYRATRQTTSSTDKKS